MSAGNLKYNNEVAQLPELQLLPVGESSRLSVATKSEASLKLSTELPSVCLNL